MMSVFRCGVALVLLCLVFTCGWFSHRFLTKPAPLAAPIRVGVLHSLSGPMAVSEKPVVDATLLAIEELNAKGGVLGRQVEPIVVDGRSNETVFARQAERLLVDEKVSVLFGCWTSSARKAVQPVVENHAHLLFYPVQYEGMEQSPNIVYTGASPNQQIIPAVNWAFSTPGRRFSLAGSDYGFPRAANEIIKDFALSLGAEIVGESYLPLSGADFSAIVADIKKNRPQVIFNTFNGSSNRAFIEALHTEHEAMKEISVMSFSVSENGIAEFFLSRGNQGLPEGLAAHFKGHYACWNYFQSMDDAQNQAFITRFKEKYGKNRAIGDPMVSAYSSVHLWAEAAAKGGDISPESVRQVLPGMSFRGPQGYITVDRLNNHTWKKIRIGSIRPDGQFDILWESGNAVNPEPWPVSRTRNEWRDMLNQMYRQWGNRWNNQS